MNIDDLLPDDIWAAMMNNTDIYNDILCRIKKFENQESMVNDNGWYDHDDDDDFVDCDGIGFANPGGNSALRAASATNPRNLPCPTCEAPNVLTPADVRRGYQCDRCADRAERGWDY